MQSLRSPFLSLQLFIFVLYYFIHKSMEIPEFICLGLALFVFLQLVRTATSTDSGIHFT
jgi:membrane protein CcdC involved in cytochrome C biogenesis